MKTERIEQILNECDGSPKAVQRAAAQILAEETQVNVGSTVAVVDETVAMGMVGKGKVKSFSDDKQYANVEFENGQIVPVLTNSLYVV